MGDVHTATPLVFQADTRIPLACLLLLRVMVCARRHGPRLELEGGFCAYTAGQYSRPRPCRPRAMPTAPCRPCHAERAMPNAPEPNALADRAHVDRARADRAHADRAHADRARANGSRAARCSTCVRCSCVRCSCVRCSCVRCSCVRYVCAAPGVRCAMCCLGCRFRNIRGRSRILYDPLLVSQ